MLFKSTAMFGSGVTFVLIKSILGKGLMTVNHETSRTTFATMLAAAIDRHWASPLQLLAGESSIRDDLTAINEAEIWSNA